MIELKPFLLACDVCGRLTVNLTECEDCGRYCCLGCIAEEYDQLTFSYYDGGVDLRAACAVCDHWEPEVGVWL